MPTPPAITHPASAAREHGHTCDVLVIGGGPAATLPGLRNANLSADAR